MQSIHRQFRSLSRSLLLTAAVSLLCLTVPTGAMAQSSDVSKVISTVAAVIPQQVRYMGAFANRGGDTVEATFRIYATAEGGEALWTETQQVAVKADGSYSVLLGAASENGLPQGVFAGGQARWLGVSIDSAEALPRTALSSVAYAMKAGDAETVGGVAAANLVTKDELAKMGQTSATAVQAQTAVQTGIEPASNPTGSGTADYVALWTTSGNLGNSGIFQASSGFLGVGTTTPGGPLQLSTGATGGANATMMLTQTSAASGNYYADIGLYNSKGLIGNLSALGAGYPSGNLFVANDVVFLGGQQNAGTNLIFLTNTSGALKFGTGGFAVANERMRIGAAGGVSVGNGYVGTDPGAGNLIVSGKVGVGTTAPAASLEVNGTAKFDGLVTFGSGQTFPGTGKGTITGVTASSPLTGGGTSGSVALGLNTTTLGTTLETTYDSRYALLSGRDNFADYVNANAAEGAGYAAFAGFGTKGSGGVYGNSDTAYGVEGVSGSGQGVEGSVGSPVGASAGVFGYTGTSFSANYQALSTDSYAGVWADSSGSNASFYPVGLFATADNGYGAIMVNNSAVYQALEVLNHSGAGAQIESAGTGDGVDGFADVGDGLYGSSAAPVAGQAGVFGSAVGASATAGTQDAYAGVWGDTGVDTSTSSYYPIGVLGTADNGYAGDFVNDSATIPTLDVYNRGTGGLGSAAKGTPGLFTTIKAGSATGTCGIGGGSVSCTGPVKSLVSTAGSRTVETYATQSAENWMEDYGTGALARGVGVVQIDATFAQTVTGDASYHVFLTPHGDSKGLYVTNLTPTSFEVRESGGGTSTLSFDYKIVGKRRGYEQQRLVDVTDRFNAEEARTKGTLAKGKAHPTDGAVRRPSPAAMPMSGRPGGGVIVPQAAGTPNKTAAGAKPEVKGVVQK
jgi:hypothetical protein